MLIEVGDYKLYKAFVHEQIEYAVIKVTAFGKKLIDTTYEGEEYAADQLITVFTTAGILCDSYLSKKLAIHDLQFLNDGRVNNGAVWAI